MQEEGARPAEAATELGVPTSTLRLYSVRFAPLLSNEAARPVERGGGKPGFRLYSQQDLAVLRDGKGLLEKGLTYEEALAELRRRWRPRVVRRVDRSRGRELAPDLAPVPVDPGHEVQSTDGSATMPTGVPALPPREAVWTSLVANLVNSMNSAQALAEEWRRLVEERNAELATLRRRLREAEEAARRPWWQRLFGGQ